MLFVEPEIDCFRIKIDRILVPNDVMQLTPVAAPPGGAAATKIPSALPAMASVSAAHQKPSSKTEKKTSDSDPLAAVTLEERADAVHRALLSALHNKYPYELPDSLEFVYILAITHMASPSFSSQPLTSEEVLALSTHHQFLPAELRHRTYPSHLSCVLDPEVIVELSTADDADGNRAKADAPASSSGSVPAAHGTGGDNASSTNKTSSAEDPNSSPSLPGRPSIRVTASSRPIDAAADDPVTSAAAASEGSRVACLPKFFDSYYLMARQLTPAQRHRYRECHRNQQSVRRGQGLFGDAFCVPSHSQDAESYHPHRSSSRGMRSGDDTRTASTIQASSDMTDFVVMEGNFTHYILASDDTAGDQKGSAPRAPGVASAEPARAAESTTHWLEDPVTGINKDKDKGAQPPRITHREASRGLHFSVYRIPLTAFTPEEQHYYTQKREAQRFSSDFYGGDETQGLTDDAKSKKRTMAQRMLDALLGRREESTTPYSASHDEVKEEDTYNKLFEAEIPKRYKKEDDVQSSQFFRKCHEILTNFVVDKTKPPPPAPLQPEDATDTPSNPSNPIDLPAAAIPKNPPVSDTNNGENVAPQPPVLPLPTETNEVKNVIGNQDTAGVAVVDAEPKPKLKRTGPPAALLERLQRRIPVSGKENKSAVPDEAAKKSSTTTAPTTEQAPGNKLDVSIVEAKKQVAAEQKLSSTAARRPRRYDNVSHEGVTRLIYSLVPCDCYHLVTHDNNPLYYAKSSRASYQKHTVHVGLISDLSLDPLAPPAAAAPPSVRSTRGGATLSPRYTGLAASSGGGGGGGLSSGRPSSPTPDPTNAVLLFPSRDVLEGNDGLVASNFPSRRQSRAFAMPHEEDCKARSRSAHRRGGEQPENEHLSKTAGMRRQMKQRQRRSYHTTAAEAFAKLSSGTDGFLLVTASLCCNSISGNPKHQKSSLLEKGLRLPSFITGGSALTPQEAASTSSVSNRVAEPSKAVANLFQLLSQSSLAQHKLRHGAIRPVVSVAVLDNSRQQSREDDTTGMYGEGSPTARQNDNLCCRGLLDHVWFSVPVQYAPSEQDAIQWMPVVLGSTDCVSDVGGRSAIHLGIFPSDKAIQKEAAGLSASSSADGHTQRNSGTVPTMAGVMDSLQPRVTPPKAPHMPLPDGQQQQQQPQQQPLHEKSINKPFTTSSAASMNTAGMTGQTLQQPGLTKRAGGVCLTFANDDAAPAEKMAKEGRKTVQWEVTLDKPASSSSTSQGVRRQATPPPPFARFGNMPAGGGPRNPFDDIPVRGAAARNPYDEVPVRGAARNPYDEMPVGGSSRATPPPTRFDDIPVRGAARNPYDEMPVGGSSRVTPPPTRFDDIPVRGAAARNPYDEVPVRGAARNPYDEMPAGGSSRATPPPTRFDDIPVRGAASRNPYDEVPVRGAARNPYDEMPAGGSSRATPPPSSRFDDMPIRDRWSATPPPRREMNPWARERTGGPPVEAIDKEPEYVNTFWKDPVSGGRVSCSIRSPIRDYGQRGATPEPTRPRFTTNLQHTRANTRPSGFVNPFSSISRLSSHLSPIAQMVDSPAVRNNRGSVHPYEAGLSSFRPTVVGFGVDNNTNNSRIISDARRQHNQQHNFSAAECSFNSGGFNWQPAPAAAAVSRNIFHNFSQIQSNNNTHSNDNYLVPRSARVDPNAAPTLSDRRVIGTNSASPHFCINEYNDTTDISRVRPRGVTAMDDIWARPVPECSAAKPPRPTIANLSNPWGVSPAATASASGQLPPLAPQRVPPGVVARRRAAGLVSRTTPILSSSAVRRPTAQTSATAVRSSVSVRERLQAEREKRLQSYTEDLQANYIMGNDAKRARFEAEETHGVGAAAAPSWQPLVDTRKAISAAQQSLDDAAQARSMSAAGPSHVGSAAQRRLDEAEQMKCASEGQRLAVMSDGSCETVDGVNLSFTLRDVSNALLLMSGGTIQEKDICHGAWQAEGVSYFMSAKPRKLRGGWENYLEHLNLYQEPFYLRDRAFIMVLRVPHHPHLRVCVAVHNVNDFISLLYESPLAKILPTKEEAWMREHRYRLGDDDDSDDADEARKEKEGDDVVVETRYLFGLWTTTRKQRGVQRKGAAGSSDPDLERRNRCRRTRRQYQEEGLRLTWKHRLALAYSHAKSSTRSPYMSECTSPLLTDSTAFRARVSFLSDRIAAYAAVQHRLNTLKAVRSAYIARRAEEMARERTLRICDQTRALRQTVMGATRKPGETTTTTAAVAAETQKQPLGQRTASDLARLRAEMRRRPSAIPPPQQPSQAAAQQSSARSGGVAMVFDMTPAASTSASASGVAAPPQVVHARPGGVAMTFGNSTPPRKREPFKVDRIGDGQSTALTPLQRRRMGMSVSADRSGIVRESEKAAFASIASYASPHHIAPTATAAEADALREKQREEELIRMDLILRVSRDDTLALALSKVEEQRRHAMSPPLVTALRLVPHAAQAVRGTGGGIVAPNDATARLYAGVLPTPVEIQRATEHYDISISQLQQLLQWQWEHYQHSYELAPLPVFRGAIVQSVRSYFSALEEAVVLPGAAAGQQLRRESSRQGTSSMWQGQSTLGVSPLARVLLLYICKWSWLVPLDYAACRRHERFFFLSRDVYTGLIHPWCHRGSVLRALLALLLITQYPGHALSCLLAGTCCLLLYRSLRSCLGLRQPVPGRAVIIDREERFMPSIDDRVSLLYQHAEGSTEALLEKQYDFPIQHLVTRLLQVQSVVCSLWSRWQLFIRGYSPVLSLVVALLALSYLLLFLVYMRIVDTWVRGHGWIAAAMQTSHAVMPPGSDAMLEQLRQALLLHRDLYSAATGNHSLTSWAKTILSSTARDRGTLYHVMDQKEEKVEYYQNGRYYTYGVTVNNNNNNPTIGGESDTDGIHVGVRDDATAAGGQQEGGAWDSFVDSLANASMEALSPLLQSTAANSTSTVRGGYDTSSYDVLPFLVIAFVLTCYVPYSPLRWLWGLAGRLFVHDEALVRRPLLSF